MKVRTIIISCLALFIIGIPVWWLSLPAKPVSVTLPAGASASDVAAILSEADIISSRVVFLLAARITGDANHLKAGTYLLAPRSSVLKIVRQIASGKARYVRVTVPEGFTSRQIAELLAAQRLADRERFLTLVNERRLEGYLFPQTYFIGPGSSEEEIIGKMTREFRRNFTETLSRRAQELNMSEPDVLTMASIVEKEAVRQEERPLIAGVFYNRLKKHWYLESCATVQFALGEHKARLTLNDVRVNSPYNTYRHFGLPPGPICSPGLASIKAALYPAETDDMFFVAASSGAHVFSRYFSEHVRNKRKQHRR
jgi:UPF0755 protein